MDAVAIMKLRIMMKIPKEGCKRSKPEWRSKSFAEMIGAIIKINWLMERG